MNRDDLKNDIAKTVGEIISRFPDSVLFYSWLEAYRALFGLSVNDFAVKVLNVTPQAYSYIKRNGITSSLVKRRYVSLVRAYKKNHKS